MDVKQKELNKIEKRNKILQRSKSAMQTFVPQWQYDYIKEKYYDIMSFIKEHYHNNENSYKNYNEELTEIYDYLQNDANLKYLMTRFFNMANMSYIIDTRKQDVNEDVLFFLKQEARDGNFYDCFDNMYRMPTLLLCHETRALKNGIYWIIFKEQFNHFIGLFTFIYNTSHYKEFQRKVANYIGKSVMWLSDIYSEWAID